MDMILSVDGMTCAHCVARVSNALSKVAGVSNVKVDLATNTATVRRENMVEDDLKAAVEGAGYVVKSVKRA